MPSHPTIPKAAGDRRAKDTVGDVPEGQSLDPLAWLDPSAWSEVSRQRLIAETLRLHERYQVEVVEDFQLCPWARQARSSDNTLAVCELGRDLFPRIDEAANRGVEVAFIVLPTYVGDGRRFEDFVARLIAIDARRHREKSPPFAMAAFHPQWTGAPPQSLTPETLIGFLRRSPNPTIQLVRLEALERVRRGEPSGTSFLDPSQIDFNAWPLKTESARPSLRQRVAMANHALFSGPTGDRLVSSVEAILRDRRSTFARLGMPPFPWEIAPEGER